MKIVNSYFVKFKDGTAAWLAVGKSADNAEVLETRPMLIPDFGMVLKHKETGEESSGHWLRGDDSADKWEEIKEESENETHI